MILVGDFRRYREDIQTPQSHLNGRFLKRLVWILSFEKLGGGGNSESWTLYGPHLPCFT